MYVGTEPDENGIRSETAKIDKYNSYHGKRWSMVMKQAGAADIKNHYI